jgi:7-cyano-7-deazaguanine synthase in queuosine biosynthesis
VNEFTVVVDDCDTPPAHDVRPIRFRDTDWGDQNFSFKPDRLAAGLARFLTPVELDWLYLLASLFAADRACNRGAGDTQFNRSIHLYMPVDDVAHWSAVAPLISRVFQSLTYDRLKLTFAPLSEARPVPRPSADLDNSDCVALLSGGMDSFVGALSLLKEHHRSPAFVGHGASGAVQHAQGLVADVIKSIDPSRPFYKFTAEKAAGSDFPGDEYTQRSRSLMFVGAAAVLAAGLGVRDVYVNENGVMAVHVPMTAARLGAYSTRTAFPPILGDMTRLARAALGVDIEIKNLLLLDTKPEVAQRAVTLGHGDQLHATVSCWKISRGPLHCGVCVPCIVRRICCEIANVKDTAYNKDILDDADVITNDIAAKDNLVHLCSLATALVDLSDEELELEYSELLNTGPGASARDVLDMYRRWGQQAVDVLDQHPVSASLL